MFKGGIENLFLLIPLTTYLFTANQVLKRIWLDACFPIKLTGEGNILIGFR